MNFVECFIEGINLPSGTRFVNHPINLDRVCVFKRSTFAPTGSGLQDLASIEFHFDKGIEKWLFGTTKDRELAFQEILTLSRANKEAR